MKKLKKGVTEKMREPLKNLWDAIVDKSNEDRMFDLISLLSLMLNNELYPNEINELRQYAKGIL